ncbi:hypothetical protein EV215_0894 [Hypnocyclicus thermotrophus]|uniref:rRNA biogenesis protein rrp5 n=2 Tax=Hypnocyclicus thermotrophus TaxID=1627895 RepID=A0AA46I5S8_9FUSO|nr:hypothetical protein EV215_0894 [Hypnocyclicus thermotrophus]
MSKIKLLLDVVGDMRSLADSIQAVCDAMGTDESAESTKLTTETKPTKETKLTLEEVRGVLAQKSQIGFTSEVRAIIQKYGVNRLSEVDPKHYAKILKSAEELGNE